MLEEFEKVKPQVEEALYQAILKAAKECPEGLCAWLGMSNPPPEDPADEEYMKEISGM